MIEHDALLQNRYRVQKQLNRGGMGIVYLAQDTRLGQRLVAVKQMDPESLAPQDRRWAQDTFRQEANILARLDHPGLAAVTDFFEEEGYLYLVMEYVQGETLAGALARVRRFDQEQVLSWGRELSAVLAYLHCQDPPIVFRDLKPDNIIVQPDGTLKLIDFGIARFFKPNQSTDTVALGTIGYAAPEQYGQGQTDPRADVYSLGVVLHQLLTGYDPTRTPLVLPPVRELAPDVSPHLALAIDQALARDPARRFADGVAFAQSLKPTIPSPVPPGNRSFGRWPSLAGAALLLAIIFATGWWWRQQSAEGVAPLVAPQVVAPATATRTTATPARIESAASTNSFVANVAPTPTVTATLSPSPSSEPTPVPTTETATAIPTETAGLIQPEDSNAIEARYLSQVARPRPAEPVVFAYGVASAPTIDGDLGEWQTTPYPILHLVYGADAWSDYADLSGLARLAWDGDNLYLALDITDDRFIQESVGQLLYRGDSAELWLDADLAGDFGSGEMSSDDSHIGVSPGHPNSLRGETYRWSPARREGPVNSRLAAARTAQGYALEWAIPWSQLEAVPRDGTAFGLTLCLSDNDLQGSRTQESMVCLHGSREHGNPTSWGTLVLIGP